MRARVMVALVAAVVLVPSLAEAQRTTRRQKPIEIRGQVPTPQVVTVRPREVPAYSRQVLVPNFYDHDFWQSILPAYQLVPQRLITGQMPGDTTATGARMPSGAGTPPAQNVTPSTTGTPTMPADTTRRSPGTSPAQSPR